MSRLDISVVAVDGMVWTGQATLVVAKTSEGEIGIMADHEPILALLANSVVRIEPTEGDKVAIAVHAGFLAVDSNHVRILAEAAELASAIDVERAKRALQRAKESGLGTPEEQAAMHRAETRLRAATTVSVSHISQ